MSTAMAIRDSEVEERVRQLPLHHIKSRISTDYCIVYVYLKLEKLVEEKRRVRRRSSDFVSLRRRPRGGMVVMLLLTLTVMLMVMVSRLRTRVRTNLDLKNYNLEEEEENGKRTGSDFGYCSVGARVMSMTA